MPRATVRAAVDVTAHVGTEERLVASLDERDRHLLADLLRRLLSAADSGPA